MESPKVTFELTESVYDILFNSLRNYLDWMREDLLDDEEYNFPHLEESRKRVELIGEMLAHLEVANSRVGT